MLSTIRTQRDDEGFTLIELLVVVIIIGILAAIAIPVFLNQRENAWRSAVESDLRNVAVEIESESTQAGGLYPATQVEIDALGSRSTDVTITLDGTSTTTQYCLTGVHANISAGDPGSAGDPIVYDSDDGGLADTTPGCA